MTEMDTNAPAPRRAPRWMKILLGVSLAVNVLIIAAAGGLALRHGASHGGVGFRDIRSFARFVPEEKRDDARVVLEQHQEEYRAAIDQMKAARRNVAEVFAADPYDPAALEQALAELRAASSATRSLAHGAMIEIGADLTAEERADVIEKFRERGRRWREQRDGRGRDGRHDGPRKDSDRQ